MSQLTLIVGAFMLALVAMSFTFAGGAVIVAVPLAIVVIAVVAAIDYRRSQRRIADPSGADEHEPIEFTARDRQTLA
jgi:hypothetical protein